MENNFIDPLELSSIKDRFIAKAPVVLAQDRKVFTCIFWDDKHDIYAVTDIAGNQVRVQSFLNRILSEVKENQYSNVDFIAGNVNKVLDYLIEKSKQHPYRYHVGVSVNESTGAIVLHRSINEYTKDNKINVIIDKDYSSCIDE